MEEDLISFDGEGASRSSSPSIQQDSPQGQMSPLEVAGFDPLPVTPLEEDEEVTLRVPARKPEEADSRTELEVTAMALQEARDAITSLRDALQQARKEVEEARRETALQERQYQDALQHAHREVEDARREITLQERRHQAALQGAEEARLQARLEAETAKEETRAVRGKLAEAYRQLLVLDGTNPTSTLEEGPRATFCEEGDPSVTRGTGRLAGPQEEARRGLPPSPWTPVTRRTLPGEGTTPRVGGCWQDLHQLQERAEGPRSWGPQESSQPRRETRMHEASRPQVPRYDGTTSWGSFRSQFSRLAKLCN